MPSTIVLTIKSGRTQTDNISRFVKDTTNARDGVIGLRVLFERIGAGLEPCVVDIQTAAAAPVRATGTYTLTYASIANSDTVTIGGGVLTCVTGTPAAAQFKKVTDGPTTAANFATAVNATAAVSKYVSATSSGAVVTLTCNASGAVGNLVTLATSNGTGFVVSAATLASGAGGAETAKVSYARGL